MTDPGALLEPRWWVPGPDRKSCAIASKGPRHPICKELCVFCSNRQGLDVDSPVGYAEQIVNTAKENA